MCWPAACVVPARACASTLSSLTRQQISRSGRSDTTARWKTCSKCRTRSRQRSPPRCGSRFRLRNSRLSRQSRPRTCRPMTFICAEEIMPAASHGRTFSFALQMYENAVALDPDFALAHAGLANVCAQHFYYFERQQQWIDRAIAATQKASANGSDAPEIRARRGVAGFCRETIRRGRG